jgi:hypothetical protein
MKKILFLGFAGIIGLSSCDKVDNAYPVGNVIELDTTLYPGLWSDYVASEWPVFAPNGNSLRNVLVEDFTGHQCTYCPFAADTAHQLKYDYPGRAFPATIHSGPNGIGGFQSTSTDFPIDWTNTDGLDIGTHLGTIPGSAFTGNPRGAISRILVGGQNTLSTSNWRSTLVSALPQALKVNIQSGSNYYPSTKGMFLHTEIDVLDANLINDLYTVVYLIEDSVIARQKMPNNTINDNYIHRDIMRDCINTDWKGRKLTDADKIDGKYYFNYSFVLPSEYNPDNMHLLIYVRDAVTEEVYHVIKEVFN